MKKSSKSVGQPTNGKSFFRSAGEIVGTVAHEIVEGKNKVVETVSSELSAIKKVIKKKIAKKKKAVASKKPKRKIKPVKKKPAKTKTGSAKRGGKKATSRKKAKALKPRH